MSNTTKTILNGLGELDRATEKELKTLAKKHNVKMYPTYYDWSLEGKESDIELITQAMWSMPKDQWEENGFWAEVIN